VGWLLLNTTVVTPTTQAPVISMVAADDSGEAPYGSSTDLITTDTRPRFDIALTTAPLADDIIKLRDSGGVFGSNTLTQEEIDAGSFDIVYTLPDGTHSITCVHTRSGVDSLASNTLTVVVDTTAPTITSASSVGVNEHVALAHTLTASESVTWSLTGGADTARFELSGSTLRWLNNGTKNFEIPDDADANNAYVVQVTATDPAGNATNQTITVTVADVAEGSVAITYRAKEERTTNDSVYTFTGFNVTSSSDDLIIGIAYRNTTTIGSSTLTVNGVAATKQVAEPAVTGNNNHAEIWTCPSQGDATPDIVVTLTGQALRLGMAVWTMTGHSSLNPTDEDTSTVNPGTDDLTIPANGGAVCLACDSASQSHSWSVNLGEDFDIAIETGFNYSGASANFVAGGVTTLSNTKSASSSPKTVFACWGTA
jgi:hypothetical protein